MLWSIHSFILFPLDLVQDGTCHESRGPMSTDSGACADVLSDPVLVSVFGSAAPAAWMQCTQRIDRSERFGAYFVGLATGAAIGAWQLSARETAALKAGHELNEQREEALILSWLQGGLCVGALGVSWRHECCSTEQALMGVVLSAILGSVIVCGTR